jgi:hypothetical protein
MTDVGATGLYPYFYIYDSTGKVVANAGNYDVASAAFTAATTGTFTVVVLDGTSAASGTGAYNLYLTVAPGANEGGALTSGAVVTGTIDEGDLDSYTFSAQSGNAVQLSVTDVASGALTPGITVYGPNGATVATTANANVASISFTAQAAGTFTVVIYDVSSGLASTGDYSLSFSSM